MTEVREREGKRERDRERERQRLCEDTALSRSSYQPVLGFF
jgi:hypothetical protein